jgi:outer membrane protein assembly factor BamB
MRRITRILRLLGLAALALTPILTTAGDWPTYLHDAQRRAAPADETILSVASAPNLTRLWSFKTAGVVAASPTVSNGAVYAGSWDGYEYALDAVTGALRWKSYLGRADSTGCGGTATNGPGVEATATVSGGVVYVVGGDSTLYALDATTGHSLWSVFVGDTTAITASYGWSSPLLANGYAYIGAASLCDTPLVQGQVLQVDLATHRLAHTFPVVPAGQIGGSIWTSPSFDPATNTLYVTTGNNDPDLAPTSQPNTVAILALDATTLAIKGAWQVPPAQQSADDSDWTTTPLLFAGAGGRPLVAAVNKGGWLYAFDRTNLGAGPLWQVNIARSGDSPEIGDSSASSAAAANGVLYQAGGVTTIRGVGASGSVRALDAATGRVLWARPERTWVLAPLAFANGLLVDGAGTTLEVLNAVNGTPIYTATIVGGRIFAEPIIANGRLYVGGIDGSLTAFGLLSGVRGGAIATVGSTASYTVTPALGGTATFGSCAATPLSNNFDLFVYDSAGRPVASGTTAGPCELASAAVTADQTYTVTTRATAGTGPYLSAWAVNNATVTWPLSGTISAVGGQAIPSIITLSAGPITATLCGPSGTIFNLYLHDLRGRTLAAGTSASNCQVVTYSASAAAMIRVRVVAVRGAGAFAGKVVTP